MTAPAPLRVALCDHHAGADPDANLAALRTWIPRARDAGAAVLVTPECALTGYPPALPGWRFDPCRVADHEDALAAAAQRAGIALALGSAGRFRDGIANELVWCGAVAAPARYRKRALTPPDRAWFAAGDASVVVEHAGWRLGLAVCFDVRSGPVWRGLAAADAVLCAAHMAGPDPDPGTKAAIVPQFFAVRAAELASPVALANTAAPDRCLVSGAWDARGLPIASGDGLVVADLVHRDALDPWYRAVRAANLDG
ncbi:MAG: hypothetical protein RLZZ127_1264 [Planctomycetota bacterium]|jgi:predicted amidohydrolase